MGKSIHLNQSTDPLFILDTHGHHGPNVEIKWKSRSIPYETLRNDGFQGSVSYIFIYGEMRLLEFLAAHGEMYSNKPFGQHSHRHGKTYFFNWYFNR